MTRRRAPRKILLFFAVFRTVRTIVNFPLEASPPKDRYFPSRNRVSFSRLLIILRQDCVQDCQDICCETYEVMITVMHSYIYCTLPKSLSL